MTRAERRSQRDRRYRHVKILMAIGLRKKLSASERGRLGRSKLERGLRPNCSNASDGSVVAVAETATLHFVVTACVQVETGCYRPDLLY